ncbi:MAG: YaeQ family protein [Oceanospirillaceae bacterium]|nr:YaeQ family protein [Oceanospirillaceae bacterium]
MAIGATIFKANLNLSNLNSHHYADFNLTLAKHPSENETRLMCRLIAFLHAAHDDLELTKGISSVDEPDLWQRDLSGNILHWIELGMPDEKRIRQASGKAQQVSIYTYHDNKAEIWLDKNRAGLTANKKVKVFHINVQNNADIENLLFKTMNLGCIIEEDQMHLSDENQHMSVQITQTL